MVDPMWPPGVPWRHRQFFSSYGCSAGTWVLSLSTGNDQYAPRYANMNGVIFMESTIRLTDISDGTSNTLLYAEWAHSILNDDPTISSGLPRSPSSGLPRSPNLYQRWQVGAAAGTQFETFYPPNAYKKFGSVMGEHATRNPTSFHPGGVNVALCDGSVRFIKETIDSWQNNPDTGYPPGISFRPDLGGVNLVAAGTYFGVWQRLSTRNFGEVVSADAF